MRNLFIVVHPDDESIGCGYLINKLYKAGDENFIGLMNIQSFKSLRNGELVKSVDRIEDFKKSLKILHGKSDFDVFSDTSLSSVDEYEIVGFIDKLTSTYNPDRVFMPWQSNHHDHRITHECCLASARHGNHNKSVKKYYFYDYPFYQFDFEQDGITYIDISEDIIEDTIKSCEIYANIMDTNSLFSPKGVKHIFESRGYEMGKKYAQKICLYKSLEI